MIENDIQSKFSNEKSVEEQRTPSDLGPPPKVSSGTRKTIAQSRRSGLRRSAPGTRYENIFYLFLNLKFFLPFLEHFEGSSKLLRKNRRLGIDPPKSPEILKKINFFSDSSFSEATRNSPIPKRPTPNKSEPGTGLKKQNFTKQSRF